MMRYTDTENTGAPIVPLLTSDETVEKLDETVWSQWPE